MHFQTNIIPQTSYIYNHTATTRLIIMAAFSSSSRRATTTTTTPFLLLSLLLLSLLLSPIQAFLTPSTRLTPFRSSSALSPSSHSHSRKSATTPLSMSLAPIDLWQGYMGLVDTHPLITKSLTSGVIVPLGDFAAQSIESYKKRKAAVASGTKTTEEIEALGAIDWKRVLRFCVFGATLQGPWNHYYFQAFDYFVPPPSNPFSMTNLYKVIFDQGIQAPIFTVVIFSYLDFLEGKNIPETIAQIKRDFYTCITTNWWVWVPATAVNYAFIPSDLRVLYVNIVFLGWCVFLSLLVNRKDDPLSESVSSEI